MPPEREVLAGTLGGHGGADARGDVGREALARLRRFGGDRLLRDMTKIFMADMPGRIARALDAAAAGDAAAVAYATHMMKSSSAQFGASELQRLCAEAEQAAIGRDLARAAALLAGIEREFASYGAWLEREVPIPRARPWRE
jgi:two-component system sensor histidine kinase/response regulator